MGMKLYDTFIESVDEVVSPLSGNYSCAFIAGFDDRNGDKPFSWQVNQLRESTGFSNIKGFRYNVDADTLKTFFSHNPNIPVFMFSKGCEKFNQLMSCNVNSEKKVYVDRNKIYLIEPWVGSSGSLSNFNSVASKIPAKHIFVGHNASRGYGINGASSSNAKTHWDAIASVGQMIGGMLNEQMINKIMDKVKTFFGAGPSKNPTEIPFSVDNLKAEIVKQKIKYPNIVLAQAVLESGHFDSDIFKENNNLFGMKQPSVRKTLATGKNRGHATFKNWVDSVRDYKMFQDQNGYSNLSVNDYMKKLEKEYCPGCDYKNKIKDQMASNKKNGLTI